ncbi:MAG TPA: Na/Pi cotransporter family protein [Tenuifilaceae bacterium]|nr:Na/Pi cotransporter family protein [Tenuifilaceae bacterium]HQB76827.1 Na/Pi cotransporter family protein [Tenuifilaceae bacterium]
MNYGLLDFLTLVGSLGLFLFGMKMMSESLQKVAGDKMRNILAAMTSNRFKGILTGMLVTMVVQSSSATTVMVVSFVNAGLLNLVQSIGVIMGANIGTTFTAWLISLLGFKFQISALALPLIGLSFPLLFSRNKKRQSWGELVIGFSLLFMGLDFLKSSVPNIGENPEILSFLSSYTNLGMGSVAIFIVIGTLLTVVIQSSSATMALTLVMCNQGWISYELAAAMVLGENIGTTITANIAAAVANVSAKRAARAHLIFNIFGVIWMFFIFKWYIGTIASTLIDMGAINPFENPEGVPIALSVFHSSFNLINTFLLVWFTPLIVKVVTKLIPTKEMEEEEFRLKHIGIGIMSTAELSLLQAKKEIIIYSKRTTKMFGFVRELFKETNDKNFQQIFERIAKYEDISDRVEVEIATYLNKVSSHDLSEESSKRLQAMFKIISDIESISDCNYNLARTFRRKKEANIWFNQEVRDNLNKMFDLVEESLQIMNANLEVGYTGINLGPAYEIEERINQYRNVLKEEHIKNVEGNKYKYQAGVIYNDLFSEAEKLADYAINVSEDVAEINKPLVKPTSQGK